MPVKRRVPKTKDDFPMPWEPRPVEHERWLRHRERLMAWEPPGRRPEEWWEYESPKPRNHAVQQCHQLFGMGELSAEELAQLMPQWRREYERSHEPGFFYCAGYDTVRHCGVFLHGLPARRALYKWAGIPPAVVKEWDAERARRTRTIKRLARVPS